MTSSSGDRSAGRGPSLPVRALLLSIGLTVLAGVTLMLVNPEDDGLARFLGSAFLITIVLGGLTAVQAVRRRRRLVFLLPAATLLAVSGCVWVLALWSPYLPVALREDALHRWAATGMTVSLALVHTGVLVALPTRTRMLRTLAVLTIICAWLFAGSLFMTIWAEELLSRGSWGLTLTFAIFAALSMLAGIIGTIVVALGVLSRANRARAETQSMHESRITVCLGCPRCGARQELRVGNARCGACHAALLIEVEEPRCECGYLLYRLERDVCPECGRRVEVPRWTGSP